MAYTTYRFSMKSEELLGASQPNIIEIMLLSDDDAVQFAQNLAQVYDVDVMTIDKELATNYALPYPTGTNTEARMVIRDAAGHVQTERIYDVASGFDPVAAGAAIIAAGLEVYPGGAAATSIQFALFTPGVSV